MKYDYVKTLFIKYTKYVKIYLKVNQENINKIFNITLSYQSLVKHSKKGYKITCMFIAYTYKDSTITKSEVFILFTTQALKD